MVNILIWNSFPLKERNGGPPTYLYNLELGYKSYLNENKIRIDFLSDFINFEEKDNKSRNFTKGIKSFLPPFLNKNLRILNYLFSLWKFKPEFEIKKLNEYDIVHFHQSIDLYKNRKILKYFNGKILLTSHSPKPAWLETIEDIYCLTLQKTFFLSKKLLEGMDLYGFKKAHILVFPCSEAIEPYLTWKRYKSEVHEVACYRYLPTGIPSVKIKDNYKDIRQKLGIPENAIVFSFIGRHSTIKGYDLLLQLGESLLNTYSNVYFLIAGKQEPIKGLTHPKWIEIGWTNDPHSFVNASDVFILPNRQTYFDLVLLEILSLGKPIILSETGGNKHFKMYSNSGLFFFTNNNLSSLEKIVTVTLEQKHLFAKYGELNKDIFDNNYSLQSFLFNYYELCTSLESQKTS